MSSAESHQPSTPHYRVDKFVVPSSARAEFLERVATTHATLREQRGFIKDVILEQASGPGAFNFVTMVEWESVDAVERASAAVAALHARIGFDRREMIARLGIEADIGNYEALAI